MTSIRRIFFSLAVSALVLSAGAALATNYHLTSIDYPGATSTKGYSINASGQVVGRYNDAGSIAHGFLFTGGACTSIDYPGATTTEAYWTLMIPGRLRDCTMMAAATRWLAFDSQRLHLHRLPRRNLHGRLWH